MPVLSADALVCDGLADRSTGAGAGDWLSGRAPRSHRGGHWFDPSIAHPGRIAPERPAPHDYHPELGDRLTDRWSLSTASSTTFAASSGVRPYGAFASASTSARASSVSCRGGCAIL